MHKGKCGPRTANDPANGDAWTDDGDVAPPAIVKKYAVGSRHGYAHKYGIPTRWVITNGRHWPDCHSEKRQRSP
ncbi:MAG: hypothetical protein KBH07_06690 [Flavobacteriales bacterium]|nr:hypothetical protein [Flavobacteriales bacterium]MBP9078696.1 hypothetical protein [Flavobacteriales bacterium]